MPKMLKHQYNTSKFMEYSVTGKLSQVIEKYVLPSDHQSLQLQLK